MDPFPRLRVGKASCGDEIDAPNHLRQNLHSAVTVQLGHKIYTLFGFYALYGHKALTWALHVPSFEWKLVHDGDEDAHSPCGRRTPSATVVNEFIYVVGGTDPDDNILSDLWRFDTVIQQWERCDLSASSMAMPETTGHKSVWIPGRGEILLISVGVDGEEPRLVLALDPGSMVLFKPRISGRPPRLLPYASVCQSASKVFVFGGKIFGEFEPHETNDLNILLLGENKAKLTWTSVATGGYVPRPRRSSTMSYYYGRLFVIGGRNDDGYMSEMDVFDPRTKQWQPVQYENGRHGASTGYTYVGDTRSIAGHCTTVTASGLVIVIAGDITEVENNLFEVLVISPEPG